MDVSLPEISPFTKEIALDHFLRCGFFFDRKGEVVLSDRNSVLNAAVSFAGWVKRPSNGERL